MKRPLRVLHVVDAMGADQHLWGKERVVQQMMCAQRANGCVEPHVLTVVPSRFEHALATHGVHAHAYKTSIMVELALGRKARARFEIDYRLQRQHERFVALYAAEEGPR